MTKSPQPVGPEESGAPGDVLVPVELMNTIWADRAGVHDSLSEPDGARSWLRRGTGRAVLEHDPAARSEIDTLAPPELQRLNRDLRDLRDALRRLAAQVTQDPREAAASVIADVEAAVFALNAAAGAAPSWSVLSWTGDQPTRAVRSAGGVGDVVVSAIAEQAVRLFTDPERPPLRACLAPSCVLYFVKDHPRREWCSAGCGNRARAARHYQRHRQDPS